MRRLLLGFLLLAPAALATDTSFVPEGAKREKLWGEGEFTEGPCFSPTATGVDPTKSKQL
jgi:hypothetical protein